MMASLQPATSVFLQLFRAHCGHSDLGQINGNWFEELTREAARLQPRPREDDDRTGQRQDGSVFKTPQQQRPSRCSQLESTPAIFREQNLCSPLFLSPAKDQEKSHVTEENSDSTAPANDVYGTSNRYSGNSPAVMNQLFKTPFSDRKYLHRTPQQDRKFDVADSFLCTPQLIRNQSSSCISESLGLEADPEMSWSSSLATPPSPTVIIAQAKDDICKPREYNREDVVIVRSLFSKMNSVAEAASLPPPPNTKIDSNSTKSEDTIAFENAEKSSGYLKAQQKKTVLNAVGDEEACQVVENAIEGMEDVLSIFFTNDKPAELRRVKVDRRIKRKSKPFSDMLGKSESLIENPGEQNALSQSENQNLNSKVQQKACSRDISLSYEWTPLNLPDTTQENLSIEIENSTCNDSQLHRIESVTKGANETNKTDGDGLITTSQFTEHEESKERLSHVALSKGKPLVGPVSGYRLSSFATNGDIPWKNSTVANQKHKLVLSTLKKQTKFLYRLKVDGQQTETSEKIDTILCSLPSNLETHDVRSRSLLNLKSFASALGPPKEKLVVNEDDNDFKDDFQKIEETFMDMQTGHTDPTATSGEKLNLSRTAVSTISDDCTEFKMAESERISQLEEAALQNSEAMWAHSSTKVNVLGSVKGDQDRVHNSQEIPLLLRNNYSICVTAHTEKAESKSMNATCSDFLVGTNLESFGGFKTASNKKIYSTQESLKKGELLLKDESLPLLTTTEAENGEKILETVNTVIQKGFQTASPEQIIITENRGAKRSILFQDIEQEICQNPSKSGKSNNHQTASNMKPEQHEITGSIEPLMTLNRVSHGEIEEESQSHITPNVCKLPSVDNQRDVRTESLKENSVLILSAGPAKMSKRDSESLSNGVESYLYDRFTESQKAEINELSSILENAGSQFDFTQAKKPKILESGYENVQNPKSSISDSQKLNTSDVWKDVDFNDSFSAGERNIVSDVLSVTSESESKSDVADCKSVPGSFIKRRHGTTGRATLANANITDEDLIKAIEMFGDLEEKSLNKYTRTMQDLNCSPNPQLSSGLHTTPLVNEAFDSQQTTIVSSQVQTKEKYFSDTGLFNQEHNCISDEYYATKLQQTNIANGERCPQLESLFAQSYDKASHNYENPASTSCQSTMPVGFATAKGKVISISKTSVDKVRSVFNDVLDTSDPCEDHCQTSTLHDSINLLIETNACQASTTYAGKKTLGPSSYQPPVMVNKNRKVSKVISDGPPQKPKHTFCVLRREVNKELCLTSNNAISNMPSFSTASGKPVHLSEEGLKSAHKMFSEVDDDHVGRQQSSRIHLTDTTVNAGSLQDIQETTCSFRQPGFSTANGKMIDNAQKFLHKAQEIFADIGEFNVLDAGQKKLSSQSKSKVCDQGRNSVCDVSDCLDHRMKSSVTQVGEIKPSDNEIVAGSSAEVLAGITPLDNISNKEMSNETSSREDKISNVSVTSFSSAAGKSIQLSKDSLKKVQGIFDDLDNGLLSDQEKPSCSVIQNEKSNPKSTFPPLGFSTASGKTVAVSHSSLQKVRQMFEDTDDTGSEARNPFQSNKTATSNLDILDPNQRVPPSAADVKIQQPSLNRCTSSSLAKASDKVDISRRSFPRQDASNKKMAFFSTASGNHVHLSRKALQKAQKMFADFDDELVGDQSLQLSVPTSSIMKKNEDLTNITSDNLHNLHRPTMHINAPVVALPPVAFSTASGKTVTTSSESLQKAKRLFVDTDNPPDRPQDSTTIKRNQSEECGGFLEAASCQTNKVGSSVMGKTSKFHSEGNESRKDTAVPVVENGSVPKMPYFSTAGGKAVTVSEESLKKTREMFSEVDKDCSLQRNTAVDIQPNSKSTSPVKVSLRESKLSEIKCSNNVPTRKSFGFSTGSGKQVLVSEDALKKVQGLFEECSTNENFEDCLKEKQESVRMSTPNPLLNKQHLRNSVPKLGDLQKDTAEGDGGKQKTSDFSISTVPLPRRVKHSTPLYGVGTAHLQFSSSHTPENDFEIEAAESAKAFMDDEDLTDTDVRRDGSCSDKLPKVRNGKRLRSDDETPRGEPPIKRQLLPEFDRSLENESRTALKPLTSSLYESLKDRRKLFYKVSLHPLPSAPASFFKAIKETQKMKYSPPKLLHSKLNISHNALSAGSTYVPPDCTNDPNTTSRPDTGSFVIPIKKKFHRPSDDQKVNSPRPGRDSPKDLTSESRAQIGTSQKEESGKDLSSLVANICCARDLQEMRIRKKQRRKVKPQPGSLYRQKTSSTNRISLVTAVEGRPPRVYTQAELYRCGVIKNHIGINGERARTFEFHCLDYFTRERFLSDGGVQIADGGWLIPTDQFTAGREEFYRALCDTPGVDPKLISPEWVSNHYRWIVWKLAAMEVMFPKIFASRCLTPDRVLLQLKYRYDVEIDKCQRSAVRKIMERDDTPAKTLVLCISKIFTLGNSETKDTKPTPAMIEVTDGWYGIKALLDPALSSLLKKGRVFIGQKIMVHGAELVGSDDACTPLEAPESLMLKIAGNSTRPARWDVKLGYFHDPRPLCLRLSSLLAEGGVVGCVDVLIQRIYPIQWMEKMGNGTYVFRNERAEEREAERHSAKQQKNLEVLFLKIQEEYEKQQVCDMKKRPRCQTLSEAQIRSLQDGADLYEALQSDPEPGYLESCLSSEQLRAVNHHRQVINDKRNAEFRKTIEASEQQAGSSTRRDVTPVWKIRIVDYKDRDSTSAYMLNIWRPLPDVVSLLMEGRRFRIYQLAASQSKGKCDMAAVQLTATKKTQFQQLQPSQDAPEEIYTERQVTEFSRLLEPQFTAAYGEVDVVGLVISTQQKAGAAPLVYLSDEAGNIVAMKLYTDLGQLALEEVTKPSTFISAANLRWRSEYMSGVPVVFAADLSFIAANPKEHHLQKAVQKLRQSIQSVPEFCREMENKLMNILQTENPQERASVARCDVDPQFQVTAGGRFCTPVAKFNIPQMKHVSTPGSNNTVLSTSIETDPKTCKKMKALDYLSRIPSPAPLTPMRTLISPPLQKAFRPPRSLQKEDRMSAKPSLNTRVPESPTPNKPGGFVADEELALINTQALLLGLEGGSKGTSAQEITTSEVQKTRTPYIRCPANEEAQKTQEVTQAPHQRRLYRKRKQKP